MRGVTAVLVAAIALAGCSGADKEDAVDPNLYPSNHQKEVLDTMRKSLLFPTNVRDAAITAPTLRPTGQEQRYAVCVRENSRDESGQYAGPKEHIGWFWGGRLNQLIDAKPGQCAGMVYAPFPALEKLCQAAKCE
jgi:hypothetical protein